MKKAIVPLVTFGVLAWAWSGTAQEPVPPPKELPPSVEPVPPPEPIAPVPSLDCHHGEHMGLKILWMERDVPITVLVPREIVTEQKRPGLAVAYRSEKCKIVEMVVKSRVVSRAIPVTIMKPCTDVCPSTGHPITIMKPCTEVRTVKDTVFYTEPVEREIVVQIPFVKEVEETIAQKTVILEYRTELQKRPSALAVPFPEPKPRYLLAPNACEHPHGAMPGALEGEGQKEK